LILVLLILVLVVLSAFLGALYTKATTELRLRGDVSAAAFARMEVQTALARSLAQIQLESGYPADSINQTVLRDACARIGQKLGARL
jgi:hypothetical protein